MAELEQFIVDEVQKRQSLWKPRDDRMDLWLTLHQLVDEAQERKPLGHMKFISDLPQSIVNRAVEIMTANPVRWHVFYDRELEEERELIRKIERGGTGLFNDINDFQFERGLPEAEPTAAWFALVRGWICSENLLTHDIERENDSPVWFNFWDPRWVYPRWDVKGMHSVVYSLSVPFSQVLEDYPDAPMDSDDLTQMVNKYIWYDRKNYVVMVDYRPKKNLPKTRNYAVLRKVTEKRDRKIPVTLVPANGLQIETAVRPNARVHVSDTGGMTGPNRYVHGKDPLSWTADRGRSIYASVERAIPQFNDYMSIMLQSAKLYAYPTLNVYTRDGSPKTVSVGTGVANSLQTGVERIETLQPPPPPPALEATLNSLARELSIGMVPPALLDQTQATSGFDRAQIINLALNSLGPWSRAIDRWQVGVYQSVLRQLQDGKFHLNLVGESNPRSYFEVSFEPGEIERRYDLRVERTPSLPDDILQRTQIAQILKGAGLASLRTIFDRVLNWEDPDGEVTKMFEDAANMVPSVVSARIVKALEVMGLQEFVPLAQNEAVIQEFMQMLQMQQLQQQAAMIGGAGQQPSPQVGPPEQVNPISETGAGGQPPTPPGQGVGY